MYRNRIHKGNVRSFMSYLVKLALDKLEGKIKFFIEFYVVLSLNSCETHKGSHTFDLPYKIDIELPC